MRVISILGVSCLTLAALVTTAKAQFSFTPFISGSQLDAAVGGWPDGAGYPIGLAYAGDRFVGSANYSGGNQLYQSNLTGTTVTTFGAPLLDTVNHRYFGGEIFVASSLATGAYGANEIYAGAENSNSIIRLAHDGSSQSVFATGLVGGVRSIAFDPYGVYGNKMVVATNAGYLYTIDGSGNASVLSFLGRDTEGLAFSNTNFGGYAQGTLFAASEGAGRIAAISPTGSSTDLPFFIPSVESIHFVPLNIGQSGNPVEGYYAVSYPIDVQKITADQFAGFAGNAIVTSETGHGIYDVKYDSNGYTVTQHGYLPAQPEDSIFVTADVVQQHGGNVPDGGTTAALLGSALTGLAVLRRRLGASKR